MSVGRYLRSQFHNPTGTLGWIAGLIMLYRESNRLRNEWVVNLLEPSVDSHVLEIGFGPGYALSRFVEACPDGRIVGIDHSQEMVRLASKRNREAIARGLLELHQTSVESVDEIAGEFDRIVAVNAYHFWPERAAVLDKLRARLTTDGRLALAVQPRSKGADDQMARRMGVGMENDLRKAGFETVEFHERDLSPLVVCAIGH